MFRFVKLLAILLITTCASNVVAQSDNEKLNLLRVDIMLNDGQLPPNRANDLGVLMISSDDAVAFEALILTDSPSIELDDEAAKERLIEQIAERGHLPAIVRVLEEIEATTPVDELYLNKKWRKYNYLGAQNGDYNSIINFASIVYSYEIEDENYTPENAESFLLPLANDYDMNAMLMLGDWMLLRNETEDDDELAVNILLNAAALGNKSAANNVAYHFASKGERLDEALMLSEFSLKDNFDPLYLDTMGMIYKIKGEIDKALEMVTEAEKHASNNWEIALNRAELEFLSGNPVKSKEKYKKALDLSYDIVEKYYQDKTIDDILRSYKANFVDSKI